MSRPTAALATRLLGLRKSAGATRLRVRESRLRNLVLVAHARRGAPLLGGGGRGLRTSAVQRDAGDASDGGVGAAARTVSVFPGHGIGPELVQAAMTVVDAAGAPIKWERVDDIVDRVTERAIDSLQRNRVGLQGEFRVAQGKGSLPPISMQLQKALDLYANVVHSFAVPGIASKHAEVDVVIIRENTEGEYSGMEHEVVPGVTESLKVMTKAATRRIAQYAFEYAYLNRRRKVTAVHKANIMPLTDGLFLDSCREMAKMYPMIEYEEIIVDNCVMQLVSRPQQFDVLITPNFYGSLISNVVAGLTGGPGLAPGANVGTAGAMFEQGARHVGLDIAGKDLANPTGIMLAAAMMLRHLSLPDFAHRIEDGVFEVLQEGGHLDDTRIGTMRSTRKFVDAVAEAVSRKK
uniref:Isopropylmalate dehydrogenase-like domain-containing protein n=1 Tax=Bicosoecida sp. CB-2014 TaxID=1486930 RepID=A0A7S1CN54_9STRA|mmetsp:Transcript_514/g.1443  ORF Transcript_514/g.1443 Transcript_514/m.1443 type:complete len:406 (+) Transcript_514:144-1361(+)